MIARLNKDFVCTSVIIDDLEQRAGRGDALAKQLAAQWEYPVEFVFLTPAGKPISKMNSKEFPGTHPDVAAPPSHEKKVIKDKRAHVTAFLKHLADHFGTR